MCQLMAWLLVIRVAVKLQFSRGKAYNGASAQQLACACCRASAVLQLTLHAARAQVFREPVTLPSGLSYEESALMEHFAKVREGRKGHFYTVI